MVYIINKSYIGVRTCYVAMSAMNEGRRHILEKYPPSFIPLFILEMTEWLMSSFFSVDDIW